MFRFTLALVLLGFLPGVAVAFVTAGAALVQVPPILWPVVAGTVAGILVDHVVFRRIPFIETFEHELTQPTNPAGYLRRIEGGTKGLRFPTSATATFLVEDFSFVPLRADRSETMARPGQNRAWIGNDPPPPAQWLVDATRAKGGAGARTAFTNPSLTS